MVTLKKGRQGNAAKKAVKAGATPGANQGRAKPKTATTTVAKSATRGRQGGKKPAAPKSGPAQATRRSRGRAARPMAPARRSRGDRPRGVRGHATHDTAAVAPLCAPLSAGERADALRVLIEDPRAAQMAQIGRYRVVATEPLALKPPHESAGRRLASVVVYDYAADRRVDALIDLDRSQVAHMSVSRNQPALSTEEESAAVASAIADPRVKEALSLGDAAVMATQYWGGGRADLARRRRSAVVAFGQPGARPTLIAVVDLLDGEVTEVAPAESW